MEQDIKKGDEKEKNSKEEAEKKNIRMIKTGKKKKEISEEEKKISVKKKYETKINYLLKKSRISDEEFLETTRNFFKEFLNIDYEFTYEELQNELSRIFIEPKIRRDINNLLDSISYTEFFEEGSFSTEELKLLIRKLDALIKKLIPEEKENTKENNSGGIFPFSLIRRLRNKRKKEAKAEATAGNKETEKEIKEAILSIKKEYLPDNKKHKQLYENIPGPDAEIDEMMEEVYANIEKNNHEKAKIIYNKVLEKYNNMDTIRKKIFYEEINQLYYKLNEKNI
ncbi:hypothetical protein JW949_00725 [Candidatus Woesearchaeota archaeon]|nr:hypothetical protein [Candidatus Woesearchaeota archaeon]